MKIKGVFILKKFPLITTNRVVTYICIKKNLETSYEGVGKNSIFKN